jgi:tRNA1(Val) A37 N6-methylase TrmN6
MAEAPAETLDLLLGGRVRLRQSAGGYRAAIDPVLLAAAVPARPGERVADLGCGAGAAALCLLARVPGAAVVGIERDAGAAALAIANAEGNGLADRCRVVEADIADLPAFLAPGSFDHAMANPPYLDPARHALPADGGRRAAHVGEPGALAGFLDAAARLLRPGGWLVLIHRADRFDAAAAALAGRVGSLTLVPLWPRAGEAARRVILLGRKGGRGPARVAPGLVLHQADGAFTPEAEAVLRDAAALAP